MVITFLVCLSMDLNSSLVHFKKAAFQEYLSNKFESTNTAMFSNSPEEALQSRTKYCYLTYIFDFTNICCCSSSYCGVPALKLIHELSLQASSDPTSNIGIVFFSFLIYFILVMTLPKYLLQ